MRLTVFRSLTFMSLLWALMLPGEALADCHPDTHLVIYEGVVGKYPVRVALMYRADGIIDGRYAYATSTEDIRLSGRLGANGKHLELTELGTKAQPTANFRGVFLDHDASFANGTQLNCEVIEGNWQSTSTGQALPFKLHMDTVLPSSVSDFDHLYAVAGVENDETVNRAAARFRHAVVGNERSVVASMIRYPVTVTINKRRVTLKSTDALLARYDQVFTPKFRKIIADAVPRFMFARYDGIMLGETGEVWLSGNGMVIGLNN
ncbi:MAG: hypothetical protein KGL97_17495 [Alphaproteobacteria bacterium]|nr:hypothetical protein [Alphaproteobacteria bacterium]